KNVLVEIRAGTGGEEAALFAADLFRMYCMYADSLKYRVSVTSANETELGGYREIVFMVEGDGAYSRFRFESGTHRVQRVPETESQGRIQTSAATVAVLPEAEDVHIEINPADLVFESCKSSGAGGQHVNKTESAVRLTHKPSGIVVECDQERSQFKNKDLALKMLKTKLYDIEQRQQEDEIAASRRSQVGSGDRSGRIRTYNFPQGRVTDHRIGLTLYSLDDFLNGNISEMIEALISADTAEKLQRQNES
ncbi:MAG: peptide chain release factor 1, partial [Clostridia bacterium]|nr:peptide chain release factor 1 [Clostridia bacterium]